MTDQELIKALKCCGSDGYNCRACPCFDECEADCGNRAPALAADRLEALLAENELLYREVAKLKAECDHFRDLTKKLWCEKQYGEDTNVSTKRLSVAELQKMTCPVWVEVDMDGVIDGYWCLCNMGSIMTPSGRMFCAKDIPSWEFYRQPPSTEVSPTGQKG